MTTTASPDKSKSSFYGSEPDTTGQHMHRELGLAPSAECSCGTGEQTAEHVPQQCPKLQELRTAVWPEETSLHSKLYSRQDLQKTAHFIVTTGLPV
nr:hypothetical protein BaRGS_014819 [Batillaria attramentaria]